MGELLNNITFIKMHAWEQPMFDAIIGKSIPPPFGPANEIFVRIK